ncbi:MAG TPA: hypothetical protein VGB47_06290 [Thermoanaerobaculia bacterium]
MTSRRRILVVVGTRPEAIKPAPVEPPSPAGVRALRDYPPRDRRPSAQTRRARGRRVVYLK